MSDPIIPRVNGSVMTQFVGHPVRLAGKVISAEVTVRLEAPHQYTSHYVEIIGVVQQDRSIVQQMATDLGDKFAHDSSNIHSPDDKSGPRTADGTEEQESATYLMKDVRSLRDWWSLFQHIPHGHLDSNAEHIVKIGQDADPSNMDEETAQVCQHLSQAMELREKYVWSANVEPLPKKIPEPKNFDASSVSMGSASEHEFRSINGVYTVYENAEALAEDRPMFDVPSVLDFYTDLGILNKIIAFGPTKSFTYSRLKLLDAKFQMYQLLSEDKEFMEQKSVPGRDFYNVRKVDTHIHHSSCMNQKHLLKFIKKKLRESPDDVVIYRDGRHLTLREVFESINMSPHDLSVDTLDVHADKRTFHRFDRFNLKYNPFGISRLREIFLKTDNYINGRYLAELTQEVIKELEASKYQHAEYRVSIYGRDIGEWDKLAAWVVDNNLFSVHVRWMIQIPRLYAIHKGTGAVDSFDTLLRNVFQPLFEVTKDPSSHPKLHIFLHQVIGFDSVDDESKPERRIPPTHIPTPKEWNSRHDPPYAYYMYYTYSNLKWLNLFRQSKGLSTFTLRPHAGEAGDVEHLSATYLTAHGINHGIQLRLSPVLQYLYYVSQVGIAMSPLSNNSLFLDYQASPFPKFFERGLNVSLSTDDPLQFHFTREPLIEEYSIAAQMWKLNTCDLCEIAHNSCLQSGFEHEVKAYWLGEHYMEPDIYKTNVPNIRVAFRHELLKGERRLIHMGSHKAEPSGAQSVPASPRPVFVTRAMPLTLSPRMLQRRAAAAEHSQPGTLANKFMETMTKLSLDDDPSLKPS